MITLRKIEKSINQFYDLVIEYPEAVKADIDEFSENSRILYEIITIYLEELKNIAQEISEEYEVLSERTELSFFQRILNNIQIRINIRDKKRCSNLISISTELSHKMEYVCKRVKQFQYFS